MSDYASHVYIMFAKVLEDNMQVIEATWDALKVKLLDWGLNLGKEIFYVVIVLLIGLKVIKMVSKVLKRVLDRANIDKSVHTFVLSGSKIGMYTILAITIMSMLGLETTSFVALIGSLGVGLSLALKESLGNVAGGVIILVLKPFKSGDYIESSGLGGTVVEIGLYHTILRTPDNKEVLIPNGDIANNSAVNYSAYDTRRLDLDIGVSYDADIHQVKTILLGLVSKYPTILKDPEPQAVITEHGDSAVVFSLRCWVKTEEFWGIKFGLMEDVKVALDNAGVGIPYPQMDIHMDQLPANKSE